MGQVEPIGHPLPTIVRRLVEVLDEALPGVERHDVIIHHLHPMQRLILLWFDLRMFQPLRDEVGAQFLQCDISVLVLHRGMHIPGVSVIHGQA